MVSVDHQLKIKLEHLFQMSGGYVLNFSNRSFAEFIKDSLGFDPYTVFDGSKANVLRQLWTTLAPEDFAKLTIAMLEHRQLGIDLGNIYTSSTPDQAAKDQRLAGEVLEQLRPMLDASSWFAPDAAEFVAKDFGAVDLAKVDVPIDIQAVIADRLEEIDTCLENSTPLAAVLLCGSTLEGLLYEVAKNNPARFNQAAAAPRRNETVLPFLEWKLSNLISVARELGILGEDVAKFAHAVREFRNYIHPHQQVKENFRPRRITAQMARQVLHAALTDLSRHTTIRSIRDS